MVKPNHPEAFADTHTCRELPKDAVHRMCPADAPVKVLGESLDRLEHMTANGGTTAWRWQIRVAAASAVMAAIRLPHAHLPEQLLHKGQQLVCALLSNEAYQARVQGARIVPMLLQPRTQVQVCQCWQDQADVLGAAPCLFFNFPTGSGHIPVDLLSSGTVA